MRATDVGELSGPSSMHPDGAGSSPVSHGQAERCGQPRSPHPGIGIGHHLTLTVNDSEQAHGLRSILAIDPGNASLLGEQPLQLFGQPIASQGYSASSDSLGVRLVANRPIEELGDVGVEVLVDGAEESSTLSSAQSRMFLLASSRQSRPLGAPS